MSSLTTQQKTELRAAFQNRKLNLFLGAGVSIGSNLPSWEKLVLAMYFSKMSEQYLGGWRPFSNYLYAIAEWHLANSPEPLEITARKLRKYYESGNKESGEFLDDLYSTLYGSCLDGTGEPQIYKEQIRSTNSTLDAVARLCESTKTTIQSVVTYNYDNLLEMALGDFPYQSVFRSTSLDPEKLAIHHVHGYVPLEKDIDGSRDNEIVFTEDQYHRVAGDPYCWSNLVQLQAMSNSVGLMIGLSLSDRNMRRLLDAIGNAPINSVSYALLKIPEKNAPEDEVLDDIHEKAKSYLDKFQRSGIKSEQDESSGILCHRPGSKSSRPPIKSSMEGTKGPRYRTEIAGIIEQVKRHDVEQQQYVLEQLGVRPVWLEEYSDIPKIIDEIMQG
ncbi:MAG: hypothetical protein GY845_05290 [Planctomycetes bacterium]|nr:hypothetical protein [Planctomycetota bacterium]